jgi:hypothetical protein
MIRKVLIYWNLCFQPLYFLKFSFSPSLAIDPKRKYILVLLTIFLFIRYDIIGILALQKLVVSNIMMMAEVTFHPKVKSTLVSQVYGHAFKFEVQLMHET